MKFFAKITFALTLLTLSVFVLRCSTNATELVVVVQSDLQVPVEIDRIQIVVDGPGVHEERSQSFAAGGLLPVTLGIAGGEDTSAAVAIVVTAFLGDRAVVTSNVRTSFIEGESRAVNVSLCGACASRTCPADQSCVLGRCETASVAAPSLPTWNGQNPPLACTVVVADGGVPPADGSTGDSGDAGEDVSVPTDAPIDSPSDIHVTDGPKDVIVADSPADVVVDAPRDTGPDAPAEAAPKCGAIPVYALAIPGSVTRSTCTGQSANFSNCVGFSTVRETFVIEVDLANGPVTVDTDISVMMEELGSNCENISDSCSKPRTFARQAGRKVYFRIAKLSSSCGTVTVTATD